MKNLLLAGALLLGLTSMVTTSVAQTLTEPPTTVCEFSEADAHTRLDAIAKTKTLTHDQNVMIFNAFATVNKPYPQEEQSSVDHFVIFQSVNTLVQAVDKNGCTLKGLMVPTELWNHMIGETI